MKFKKSISIIVICSFFFFSQSHRAEALPAAIVPAVIGGAALLFGAGAVKYYKPPQISTAAIYASAQSIGRVVNATFNAVIDANVSAATGLYSKLVTAKDSLDDMRQYVNAHATEYTKLFNTFNSPAAYSNTGGYTGIYTRDANGLVTTSGTVYTVWTKQSDNPAYSCNTHPTFTPQANERIEWYVNESPPPEMSFCTALGYPVWGVIVWIGSAGVTTPNPPATNDQAQATINNVVATTPDFYTDEIDKYLTGNSGSLSIVDTSNPTSDIDRAPPFVPPAAIPTTTNSAPTTTTVTVASNIAGYRQQQATDAQAALDNYKAGHPTSTVANDSVLAGLEKAAADAKTAATAATNVATQTQAETDVPLPPAGGEPPEGLNIASWSALIGAFTQLGPFKLLSNLEEYISQLVRSPEAPKFELPLPLGNTMTIDLAPFDPVASLCRWFMSLLIAIGTILFAVRFWRGN